MPIRSNFKRLRAVLEAKDGQRYSYREVSKQTGIPPATLIRFADDKVESVSYKVLENLQQFFKDNGIECEIGDLLVHENDLERSAA